MARLIEHAGSSEVPRGQRFWDLDDNSRRAFVEAFKFRPSGMLEAEELEEKIVSSYLRRAKMRVDSARGDLQKVRGLVKKEIDPDLLSRLYPKFTSAVSELCQAQRDEAGLIAVARQCGFAPVEK